MKTTVVCGIAILMFFSFFSCENPTLNTPEDDDTKPTVTVDPDPVKTQPSVNVPFVLDLTSIPGGTPEDYGFTGDIENITIDEDGNIVTTTPLDTYSTVTLPPIGQFDRDKNGGVVLTWEMKLPYWDGMIWQEKNKLYVTLEDDSENGVYEVVYMPNSPLELFYENVILTGFPEGVSSTLGSGYTWIIPPAGPDAVWISFKLVLNASVETGGAGMVELYHDETGAGFSDPLIIAADESGKIFSRISLTHRNAENPNYQILVRNISIRTVE